MTKGDTIGGLGDSRQRRRVTTHVLRVFHYPYLAGLEVLCQFRASSENVLVDPQ